MRALLLLVLAALLAGCTTEPSSDRRSSTATPFTPAVYTAAPTVTPPAAPNPCVVDIAAHADLIRRLQVALARRDEGALGALLSREMLWTRWERNQAGTMLPVGHENLSRMLAPPPLTPVAIVQAGVTPEATATGVLLDGWQSRQLIVDVRPVDGPPGSPIFEQRTLDADSVVFVFAKCGHDLSQSGLFFGLAPGDGWTKAADLPSVSASGEFAPIRTWNTAPPPTGIAHIDAILETATRNDAPGLARYVTGRSMPCSTLAACPSGTPAGTTVRVVSQGGACEAGVPLTLVDNRDDRDRSTTRRAFAEALLADPTRRVLGLWEARTGTLEATKYRYVLVRAGGSTGDVLWLDESGITTWFRGFCGEDAVSLLDRLNATHRVVRAPP